MSRQEIKVVLGIGFGDEGKGNTVQWLCKEALLKNKTIAIKAKVGDNGKLFGAVTAKEIAEAVTNAGIEIDKKQIILDTNIKSLGQYNIEAKLYSGVYAKFSIVIE